MSRAEGDLAVLLLHNRDRSDTDVVEVNVGTLRDIEGRLGRLNRWSGHLQSDWSRVRRESAERIAAAYALAREWARRAGDTDAVQRIEAKRADDLRTRSLINADRAHLDRFRVEVLGAMWRVQPRLEHQPGRERELLSWLIGEIERLHGRYRASPTVQAQPTTPELDYS